jgi:hypothetical protein
MGDIMDDLRTAIPPSRASVYLGLAVLLGAALLAAGCQPTESAEDDTSEVSQTEAALAGGWDAVTWTGDGRFVVTQTFDETGMPIVMAWDSETGDSVELADYVVLSAEPASSVIWVEPKTAEDVAEEMLSSENPYLDIGPVDSPPERLEAWDLALEDSEPSDAVPGKYQPHEGGVEHIAYYELDAVKGALPSKLLFNNLESSGDGWKAQLPDDLVTFTPVGWAPSGQYIAVEEMLSSEALLADSAAEDGTAAVPQRRLLVVDPATGEVVSETMLSEGVLAPVRWLGDDDILVWVEDSMEGGEDSVQIMAQEVGGEPGTFFEVTGVETPAEWAGAAVPTPLGSGTFGLMVSAWSEEEGMVLWRLDSVSAERVGAIEYVDHLDWSQAGGVALLVLEADEDAQEDWVVVSVAEETGDGMTEVLVGPRRPWPAEFAE